jgi:putative ABC transport system ATP-binding protein
MLGGLLRPYKGHVIIDGHDLTSLRKDGLDKFRGQNIGLVFQKPHLIQSLNVKENLLAAQFFAGLDQDNHRINEVLDELNMGHKIHAPVYSLSQGEAQRVSIARAMLNKPKVILADEPTSSLDDDNCTAVINLLEEQAAKCGAALVISTHDQRLKDRVSTHLVLATHV